jgi:hypothetical protein
MIEPVFEVLVKSFFINNCLCHIGYCLEVSLNQMMSYCQMFAIPWISDRARKNDSYTAKGSFYFGN